MIIIFNTTNHQQKNCQKLFSHGMNLYVLDNNYSYTKEF